MSVPRTSSAAQRRTIFQRGKTDSGTQVSVGAKFAAQTQESRFGAKVIRIMIERGISHRAHQDRGRRKASLNGVGGQRIFYHGQRRAADVLVLELKLMAECVRNGLQDKNGLLGDFGADAVAGEDGEV